MDRSRLPELTASAHKTVRRASRPNGTLSKGKFTMAVARREIALEMRLGDELEEKRWKGEVRRVVEEALVGVSSDYIKGYSRHIRDRVASSYAALLFLHFVLSMILRVSRMERYSFRSTLMGV